MLKINSHFLQLFLSGRISIIQPEKKKKNLKEKKNQISLQELRSLAMLNIDPRAGGTRNIAHLLPLLTYKLEIVEISGIKNEGFGGWHGLPPQAVPRRELQRQHRGRGHHELVSNSDIPKHLSPPMTKV